MASLFLRLGTRLPRAVMLICIISLLVILFFLNSDSPQADVKLPGDIYRNRYILQDRFDGKDQSILTRERLLFDYEQGGTHFVASGRNFDLSSEVTMSLVHSFSPYVEREAAKRFLDPAHDNVYFANSPAVLWHQGELILVTRIWLDREKYEPKKDWPANHFADNFLYTQKFDHRMRPVSNGSIIGIPSPKQWWVGDGPIEPRLTQVKGHVLVSFNAAMAFNHETPMDYTALWDLGENYVIVPQIEGGTPMVNATEKDDMPRDKHWMALIQHDELYFVHNLDPLRVMKCTLRGYCSFVHNEKDNSGFIFQHHISHLRGGTPFEHYSGEYFISIAHSTMYKTSNHHRFYTAHLVVLHVNPYRIVYVSDHLQVHPQVYRDAPMVRWRWIDDGFIFPVGLIIENKDSIIIGVHVNDFSSVLLRMRGVAKLMESVIQLDQRQNSGKGPPIGCLHKHVHDREANLTTLGFV